MAFVSTIISDPYDQVGRLKTVRGTYTNGAGDSGGEVETTLTRVFGLYLQPTGAAVSTNANAINETFPFDGSALTIVTDLDEDGTWEAWGY